MKRILCLLMLLLPMALFTACGDTTAETELPGWLLYGTSFRVQSWLEGIYYDIGQKRKYCLRGVQCGERQRLYQKLGQCLHAEHASLQWHLSQ